MSVAEIMKEVRQKIGVSPPSFSQMLGYKSKSHVWLIEKGKRKASILTCRRLIKLAHGFGITLTMDMLLGEDNEFTSSQCK